MVVVAVFNVADVVTTHLVLGRAGVEANPIAGVLLGSGAILWVKLALIALVMFMAIRIPPRVGVLLMAWFVAGVYGAAVLSNALVLRLT